MPEFKEFVERHGEFAVQALIENIERFAGIRANIHRPLEERWNIVMVSASEAEAA